MPAKKGFFSFAIEIELFLYPVFCQSNVFNLIPSDRWSGRLSNVPPHNPRVEPRGAALGLLYRQTTTLSFCPPSTYPH